MNQSEMLTRLVERTDLDVLMLASRYTLLEQGALDDLLPACLERGVSVVAAGVFNSTSSPPTYRSRPSCGVTSCNLR
jgi:D-threo-aldose 1-dehydrogenase